MFPIGTFLQRAIIQGTPLLFGSTGEILTEKSGNLNLGIPGIMYIGAISGVIGAFFYQESVGGAKYVTNTTLAILIPILCCILGSVLASLIYCFLTVTLRANQNVTGLALTTFGIGFGNFFGGSLVKLVETNSSFLSLTKFSKAFCKPIFSFSKDMANGNAFVQNIGTIFFSYGFMVYLAILLALIVSFILKKTRVGLHLRAVGENPATADAAGINITAYKYFATCIGGAIAGLGGLYYVFDYCSGVWSNGSFGDRGWLAIALVIFAIWKPTIGIAGSYLFGGLYILNAFLSVSTQKQPLIQMVPYLVTILVLIIISIRRKRENQPPASLGLSYFREDR